MPKRPSALRLISIMTSPIATARLFSSAIRLFRPIPVPPIPQSHNGGARMAWQCGADRYAQGNPRNMNGLKRKLALGEMLYYNIDMDAPAQHHHHHHPGHMHPPAALH